mmetsp:Transcript_138059/g.429116  ORF Transcript_138059/g.429116 Transcript_138059/m.429116 type:complete len:246 (+) Transcript_138059:1055-1792(+)
MGLARLDRGLGLSGRVCPGRGYVRHGGRWRDKQEQHQGDTYRPSGALPPRLPDQASPPPRGRPAHPGVLDRRHAAVADVGVGAALAHHVHGGYHADAGRGGLPGGRQPAWTSRPRCPSVLEDPGRHDVHAVSVHHRRRQLERACGVLGAGVTDAGLALHGVHLVHLLRRDERGDRRVLQLRDRVRCPQSGRGCSKPHREQEGLCGQLGEAVLVGGRRQQRHDHLQRVRADRDQSTEPSHLGGAGD